MISWECKLSIASTNSWKNSFMAYFFLLLRTCSRFMVSHYMTIVGGSSCEKTSMTFGIAFPAKTVKIQCSLTKLVGRPIFGAPLKRLTATSSLDCRSCALQISPQEPSVMRSSRAYFSMSLWPYIPYINLSLLIYIFYFLSYCRQGYLLSGCTLMGHLMLNLQKTQKVVSYYLSTLLHISRLLILVQEYPIKIYFLANKPFMTTRKHHKLIDRNEKVKPTTWSSFKDQQSLLQQLQSDGGQELTSTKALELVHRHVKRGKVKHWNQFESRLWQILRVCKICEKWKHIDSILTCFNCEDHYHKQCYQHKIRELEGNFVCQRCWSVPIPTEKCKVCDKQIDKRDKTPVCQYCDHEYHQACGHLKQKSCRKCIEIRRSIFITPKHKIIKKDKQFKNTIRQTNRNLRDMFAALQEKKNIVGNPDCRLLRRGLQFKALTLLEGKKELIDGYRNQLKNTIKAKGMKYTEDLKDIEFHLSKLQASMELGLANMSKEEQSEYLKYKSQPIGPFLLEYSQEKGYGVIADMDIPERSIICEYVGEVVTLRECAQLDSVQRNDSLMDLWVGRHSDEKLIIRPENWTNIARFLNGVKSHQSPRNVDSMRLCYRGLPLVLLIARRHIKKGESLVYDYNAGGINAKYDTSGFVE